MRIGMGLLLMIVLAGCATGGSGDPAQIVQDYLQAKVEGDRDRLAALLCADLEADLDREARTFATVTGVSIEGMACTFDDANRTVACTGEIVATYGAQDTNFPLTTYAVVREDGEWKWCGEA